MAEWPEYLMGFARHAATQSKDTTKVGAALVAPDGRTVLLTAYNGPPAGVDDTPDRRERPAKYLYAAHAEQNLIAFAAKHGIITQLCTVYVTHLPCSACAKVLIQAGVREVVCEDGTTSMPAAEFDAARAMFSEADVIARRTSRAASQPAPLEGVERGDLGELERLSAEAPAGLWRAVCWGNERYPYPMSIVTADDQAWVARDGTASSAATSAFIVALVNAYRSGKLVPAAPTPALDQGDGGLT